MFSHKDYQFHEIGGNIQSRSLFPPSLDKMSLDDIGRGEGDRGLEIGKWHLARAIDATDRIES